MYQSVFKANEHFISQQHATRLNCCTFELRTRESGHFSIITAQEALKLLTEYCARPIMDKREQLDIVIGDVLHKLLRHGRMFLDNKYRTAEIHRTILKVTFHRRRGKQW